jgi:hypothetical protein
MSSDVDSEISKQVKDLFVFVIAEIPVLSHEGMASEVVRPETDVPTIPEKLRPAQSLSTAHVISSVYPVGKSSAEDVKAGYVQ